MNFINLTNGIQAITDYNLKDYHFIWLQSTACEQKRWGFILETISDEFLLSLALGKSCVVYDYGAHKEIPRAIWQGIEWLKFALLKRWFGQEYYPLGRCSTSKDYFEEQYKKLDKKVLHRLDYFKKFLNTNRLYLVSITNKSGYDGNYEHFKEVLMGKEK